jgi:hypothetical protein
MQITLRLHKNQLVVGVLSMYLQLQYTGTCAVVQCADLNAHCGIACFDARLYTQDNAAALLLQLLLLLLWS